MDEAKGDPMLRDRKRLSRDTPMVMIHFLFCVLVALPFALFVLLPLTITAQGLLKLVSMFRTKVIVTLPSKEESWTELQEGALDIDRKYDLVVFGATGFTGRMAAIYLAKNYGKTLRWAIAGRRQGALEHVRSEVSAIDKSLADLPIIIADSSNMKSLHDMVISTKVVITTAGKISSHDP